MKKIIALFMILCLFLIPNLNVKAEELDDSTLTKFNYYPLGSLSSKRELMLKWTSNKKMENLSIKVYSPKEDDYIEIYNMNWDFTIDENPYNVSFKVVSSPVDDELTPDVDESLVGDWNYEMKFLFNEDSLEIIKLVFDYDALGKNYFNSFIIPNVVYPITPPTENPAEDDEEGNESSYKNYSTKNALIAAVFATICSVIGTILIIISSNRKTIEDDEEILS